MPSWKCYANSIPYRHAPTKTHNEEIKEEDIGNQGHDLTLKTEDKYNLKEGELAPGGKPADSKHTFLAIRVPYGSRIEIPDPEEVASYYRALGYHEEMIKSYLINIEVRTAALSGSFSGQVSSKEIMTSNVLEN